MEKEYVWKCHKGYEYKHGKWQKITKRKAVRKEQLRLENIKRYAEWVHSLRATLIARDRWLENQIDLLALGENDKRFLFPVSIDEQRDVELLGR